MSDFYAFMTDEDDPAAFTDAGLKAADRWIRGELKELALDDTPAADDQRAQLAVQQDAVRTEMDRRGLTR